MNCPECGKEMNTGLYIYWCPGCSNTIWIPYDEKDDPKPIAYKERKK